MTSAFAYNHPVHGRGVMLVHPAWKTGIYLSDDNVTVLLITNFNYGDYQWLAALRTLGLDYK